MLTEAEKAWLACAIDGEGTICIYTPHKDGCVPSPTFSIYNSNYEFLEHAQTIVKREFGKSPKILPHISNISAVRGRNKDMYRFTVTGSKCNIILKQILPYLIIKTDKALKSIDLNTVSRQYRIKNHRDALGRFIGISEIRLRPTVS